MFQIPRDHDANDKGVGGSSSDRDVNEDVLVDWQPNKAKGRGKKSYLEMKLLKSWDTTFTGMETNISQLSTNLENLKGSLDVEILKIREIREELKTSFHGLDICSIPSTSTVLDDKSLGDSLKDLSKCMETQMDKVK